MGSRNSGNPRICSHQIPDPLITDSGLYVVTLRLGRKKRIRIGKLGVIEFQPGCYLYVGSASKNLRKRIERHKRREKPLQWHIDYIRRHCRFIGVTLAGIDEGECSLAERVIRSVDGKIAYPRFGASDCNCAGHLIFSEEIKSWKETFLSI